MDAARRNLKIEYTKKASGAMHRKLIDTEVEKFKQRLARLKRINAVSNRPVRKPLRVRFQRMAIRSRDWGFSAAKLKINKDSKFKYLGVSNLPDTSDNFFGPLPIPQLQLATQSSSVESLASDTSLPVVYGNSMYEIADIQKGPNTTPISFLSEILPRLVQEPKEESCFLEEEFFPSQLYEVDSIPSPTDPDKSSSNEKGVDQYEHDCVECGDFIPYDEEDEVTDCSSDFKEKEITVNDPSETASKTENERKRKVKNSSYEQLMSYVCNKGIRATQVQTATSTKVFTEVVNDKKAHKRDEKIAMVLGYLQQKKNSPHSSLSTTPLEPVTKANTNITQTALKVLHNSKTDRANAGPYEHRYEAQRSLIKKQKMQLEEQQRKIQELTIAKLHEEAKNSQKDYQKTIDELEDNCTLSIRPQLKALKGTGQPDFMSAGRLVERMEKRAKEREEKKRIAAEHRKHLEDTRKKSMQKEEENRKKEEEEKKRKAFEKIREENIRQREIRERKRKEEERMFELRKRAEFFNTRRLLKTGMRAFKLLLIRRDELAEKAHKYYTSKVLRTAFLSWKKWVDDKITQKLTVADCFYHRILKKNIFNNWKKELTNAVRKRQVAEDMYEMRLQERVFRKWSKFVNQQHLKMAEDLATADQYYTWVLLKKAFYRLRGYPKIAHLEREKERRKMVLRQKVQDMLPDFRPLSPQY